MKHVYKLNLLDINSKVFILNPYININKKIWMV